MPTKTPTYAQIKQAFIDHGVRFKETKGCTTIGRPWDAQNPLVGHVHHHTSTPSATGDTGAPTLEWILTAFNKPAANALVGRDGVVYICSWGSCWHSGLGGPWKSRGLGEGNVGHLRLWGTEIDDPGVGKTITAAQIETVGRMDAAFLALCGWDKYALINHADWTDAGQWLKDPSGKADGPAGKYEGRKNDTLRKYYSAEFWRENAQKYVLNPKPPVPVPPKPPVPPTPVKPKVSLSRVVTAAKNDPKLPQGKTTFPVDVKIVEAALAKEGLLEAKWVDGAYGTKTVTAYSAWQKKCGATGSGADGIPGRQTLTLLGAKYGFEVI